MFNLRSLLATPYYTGKRCCFGLFHILGGVKIAASISLLSTVVHFCLIISVLLFSPRRQLHKNNITGLLACLTIIFASPSVSCILVFVGVRKRQTNLLKPFKICMVIGTLANGYVAAMAVVAFFTKLPGPPSGSEVAEICIFFLVYFLHTFCCVWFFNITNDAIDALRNMKEQHNEQTQPEQSRSMLFTRDPRVPLLTTETEIRLKQEVLRLTAELEEARKSNATQAPNVSFNCIKIQSQASKSEEELYDYRPPAYDEVAKKC